DNYNQNVDTWLSPSDPNYNKPIISTDFQQIRMQELYQHLFSTDQNSKSPWSANFINAVFNQHPGIPELESAAIEQFSNVNQESEKLNYGENYRLYLPDWINKIINNINTNYPSKFSARQRGIIVKNTPARVLPTYDPSFYSYKVPGEGYPFDNLQD